MCIVCDLFKCIVTVMSVQSINVCNKSDWIDFIKRLFGVEAFALWDKIVKQTMESNHYFYTRETVPLS